MTDWPTDGVHVLGGARKALYLYLDTFKAEDRFFSCRYDIVTQNRRQGTPKREPAVAAWPEKEAYFAALTAVISGYLLVSCRNRISTVCLGPNSTAARETERPVDYLVYQLRLSLCDGNHIYRERQAGGG